VTTVYIPGTWDLLHVGHVRALERASQLGDRLVVGVEADDLVVISKGRLPVVAEEHRREMVDALRVVDDAIIYYSHDYAITIDQVGADILIFSGDHEAPRHLAAVKHMKDTGRCTMYLPRTPGVSSTSIRNTL